MKPGHPHPDVAPAGDPVELAALARRAKSEPLGMALQQKRLGIWVSWTWADYAAGVAQRAEVLQRLGAAPGARVLLVGEASADLLLACLAIRASGATAVLAQPDGPQAEWDAVLRHGPYALVLADSPELLQRTGHAAAGQEQPRTRLLLLRRAAGNPLDSLEALLDEGPSAAASRPAVPDGGMQFFTAPASGRIRPHALGPDALAAAARRLAAAALQADERVDSLCQLPLAHAFEWVAGPAMHLLRGGCLSFAEHPDTVGADLAQAQPRQLSVLPWQIDLLVRRTQQRLSRGSSWGRRLMAGRALPARLLRRGLVLPSLRRQLGLARVRLLLCHGGTVRHETLEFLAGLGLPVLQVYGTIETAACALVRSGTDEPWRTLAGVRHRIEHHQLVLVVDGLRVHTADAAVVEATGLRIDGPLGKPAGASHAALCAGLRTRLEGSTLVMRAAFAPEAAGLRAIIEIDAEGAGAWARQQGLAYTTYASLASKPELRQAIEAALQSSSAGAAVAHGVAARLDILSATASRQAGQLSARGQLLLDDDTTALQGH